MGTNSGQATIEATLSLLLGISVVTLLFWSVAMGWSYFWSRYQLYEAVVCLQDRSVFECERRFRKKMRSITPYAQIDSLYLQKNRRIYRGRCHLHITFLGKNKIFLEKFISR